MVWKIITTAIIVFLLSFLFVGVCKRIKHKNKCEDTNEDCNDNNDDESKDNNDNESKDDNDNESKDDDESKDEKHIIYVDVDDDNGAIIMSYLTMSMLIFLLICIWII